MAETADLLDGIGSGMEEAEGEEKIVAIDLRLSAVSGGVAYYRIPPHFRDFIDRCRDEHEVIGFEYTYGELNFGVILKDKED